ncbi:Homeobox-leucine zipper protein hdg2 [Datura stramonium]|uniref:Homeobox-leucine zipper protein hdg2 n=1 Tax=Datura stramonium TaxID=4076 RepID=A0ABS8T3S4_DATST|nr:Homeobox-leucine zipper protein hdg2 [Datura stramonium]
MVMSFCAGVGASTAHTWTTLSGSGADDVRVMTRKSIDDPGRPPGIVLSAATSFWLPVPTKTVFDFLRDENSRNEWDILSNGGQVQEMAHIANGRDSGNSVSLLRVNRRGSGLCGSFAIWFHNTPDSSNNAENSNVGGGSLLTVAFQILVDSVPTAKLSLGSVATVNSLIKCTVERIKAAIPCQSA